MLTQFKWLLLLLELAVTAMLVSGCPAQLWNNASPPYTVTAPVYRLAGPDDICSFCGVFFDFYNKSEKEVIYIKICMNIYDSQSGALAFDGAAELTCGTQCHLQKSQKTNFCVSLDQYNFELANQTPYIDNFYISRIEYTDGTSWTDVFGVYADSYQKEA